MTIEELSFEAYPVTLVSYLNETPWDINEQYRSCWVEGYKKALSLASFDNQACKTFVPDMSLTTATKCKVCGQEKCRH